MKGVFKTKENNSKLVKSVRKNAFVVNNPLKDFSTSKKE